MKNYILAIILLVPLLSACGDGSTVGDDGDDYYTVAGSVTGLPDGKTVLISDSAGDGPISSGNGDFNLLTTVLVSSGIVTVQIFSAPANVACTVTEPTSAGDVAGYIAADILTVQITCATKAPAMSDPTSSTSP